MLWKAGIFEAPNNRNTRIFLELEQDDYQFHPKTGISGLATNLGKLTLGTRRILVLQTNFGRFYFQNCTQTPEYI